MIHNMILYSIQCYVRHRNVRGVMMNVESQEILQMNSEENNECTVPSVGRKWNGKQSLRFY